MRTKQITIRKSGHDAAVGRHSALEDVKVTYMGGESLLAWSSIGLGGYWGKKKRQKNVSNRSLR